VSITPPDYLQFILLKFAEEYTEDIFPAAVPLGEGMLADEYEQMLQKRLAEDAEQIASDILLARQLSECDEIAISESHEVYNSRTLNDEDIARSMDASTAPLSLTTGNVFLSSASMPLPHPQGDGKASGSDWFQKSSSLLASGGGSKLKSKEVLATARVARGKSTAAARPLLAGAAAVDIRSFLLARGSSDSRRSAAPVRPEGKDPSGNFPESVVGSKRRLQEPCSLSSAAAAPQLTDLQRRSAPPPWPVDDPSALVLLHDESSGASTGSVAPEAWGCPACTFRNFGLLLVCEMCQHPQRSSEADSSERGGAVCSMLS
jgi:hypothetical protein